VCSAKHASDELVDRLVIAVEESAIHGTADGAAAVGACQ
jgi:hypothetical protein